MTHRTLHFANIAAVLAFGCVHAAAQDIAPYQAESVRPQTPSAVNPPRPTTLPNTGTADQKAAKDSPAIHIVTLPPEPTTAPVHRKIEGNLVEPLSNGLQLAWSAAEIKKAFGAGTPSWDSRTITYSSFRVAVGGGDEKIWHLHLTGRDVALNSGIRPGSRRADVERVFGKSDAVKYEQYSLTFVYDGDTLVDIGIDPANGEFAAYQKVSTKPKEVNAAASILGKWWGVQSMTQIDIKPDGTYTSPNGAKGAWAMTGEDIIFTGPLSGWNGGRAKLTQGGWIEFLWKDKSGAAYLFQLVRR